MNEISRYSGEGDKGFQKKKIGSLKISEVEERLWSLMNKLGQGDIWISKLRVPPRHTVGMASPGMKGCRPCPVACRAGYLES